MNYRSPIGLTICLLSLSLLSGCKPASESAPGPSGGNVPASQANGTPNPPGPTPSGKTYKLAFVTNNASDFWTIARAGVEQADKDLPNVTAEFKMDGDGSAAEQQRIVDDLLAKNIDGFAISAVDPKNQTDMLNNAASKALVFTQDSDAPASKRTCYIGTDNVAAGHMAGEEIKKALPNGGKIMMFVGARDVQNAKEREQGIRDVLKGTKITVVDVRTDDTDHAKAKSNVADSMVKYPDLAGLVGLWSYNGPAILNAVKEANKVGKVKIVCFDEEADTLSGVKSGAISATIVQQPYEFGYQAMKNMAAYLGGDKTVVPASQKIIVPTRVINKDNEAEFETKLKQQRGK